MDWINRSQLRTGPSVWSKVELIAHCAVCMLCNRLNYNYVINSCGSVVKTVISCRFLLICNCMW